MCDCIEQTVKRMEATLRRDAPRALAPGEVMDVEIPTTDLEGDVPRVRVGADILLRLDQEIEVRRISDVVEVVASYCPFCGEKYPPIDMPDDGETIH